ncbi:LacI family DNA-binding transcriptional regulator [Salmonella enterica]|nr:LacI family DNA-binding transcriptional regulator [Salmonella enterica]
MKLDEIARLAGVSRTTASYVINGKAKQYRVSDKTVEKVMAVVREHNYHPNAVAAGLRAGRTRSIGLVIPDLENTSYTRIANYLERQARQRGYQLLIACSEDQPDNEMRCIEHLLQRQVDAIIVSTSLPTEHPFYHPMPQALFTTSFALLQGVMDVTLRRDGKLPSDLAIATFGDHELLDFLQCPVLAVAQRHRDVAERVLEIVLASLDEPRKPKPGLTRIRRNLYRRGILSRS